VEIPAVMAGFIPAIHVLVAPQRERRGWTSPAMTNFKDQSDLISRYI
jgi:hypothetical protein